MKRAAAGKITQAKEFRFIGMSRSGNHAIINWVINQLPGSYVFLNCTEPKHNPYTSARPLSPEGKWYQTNITDFDPGEEISGNFRTKDFLLYSHEDCFLGTLNHSSFRKNHDLWMGKSEVRKDLLVLRDPFNLFASRIKSGLLRGHYSHGARPISTLTLKRIYKQHVREFLGEKKNLKNLVRVNFNSWIQFPEYREQITRQLGIPFTDKGFWEVSRVAGGSSFDGLKHSGKAYKMDLHDRWKEFADDEEYWELFDTELVELTYQIFGNIEPVEFFQKKYSARLAEK